MNYRLHGKENRSSFGAYLDIGLKEARDIARGAHRAVAHRTAQGQDRQNLSATPQRGANLRVRSQAMVGV
ncbi:Arm DNA-binding domain-containing protein [Pseudomonas orientalis]|uniref:Arm DNA-binding domain-containing protein n=1 Tax=Pseudomonas orientalis TaxID=76758 RepID=UPI0030B95C41